MKKNLDENIYEKLNSIKASGQNTLIDGFNLSKKLLLSEMEKHSIDGKSKYAEGMTSVEEKNIIYENRVILLSDVEDNSIHYGIQDIKNAASSENVHLTLIGISTHFNSKAC